MAAFFAVAASAICFKLLLIPAYKSTDFDVHRNWLAITHSLPVRKWYCEATSEWTLDYPPLFAWLEYVLSLVAVWFDPQMLVLSNVDHASPATVLFQRLSVILTDLVFVYAVKEFCFNCLLNKKQGPEADDFLQSPSLVLASILLTNFGLFIVDHIHFQYNGFLFGLLLLSIVRIYQGRHMSAAFWFAVLLNFKHIYLYVAPAYFMYLLRCCVFQSNEDGSLRWRSFSITRLVGLGAIVAVVFGISFGPFIILGQIPQLLSRLFPFKRGLCHAYWAPNFWALYNVADKGLAFIGGQLGLLTNGTGGEGVMTGGLVQEYQHTVLPSISPLTTLVCTAISLLPAVLLLWVRPNGPQSFVRALVLCAFGAFMFGWHVHEKAVLIIIIPMSLLVMDKKRDSKLFLVMATIGHYSLFPLLFTHAETPIKICLLLLTSMYSFTSLANIYRSPSNSMGLPLLSTWESLYLLGIVPLEVYNSVIHGVLGLSAKLPFLPLMLTSCYCALGVVYCWIKSYWLAFQDKPKFGKQS